jgi:predicted transcriptional regulator
MSPFDFVNDITYGKKNLIGKEDDLAEKLYQPFLVNKSLSYFSDTIMYANEMNRRHGLDNKLQYQYLLNSIRPSRRYAKWVKKVENSDFEAVQEYFKYSNEKTFEALSLLSSDQISLIKEKLKKGE